MLSIFLSSGLCLRVQAHEEKSFLAYMRETNQLFTGEEYHFRLGVYLANKRLVEEHNRGNFGYKLGMNHLACLTQAEYRVLLGYKNGQAQHKQNPVDIKPKTKSAPASVDWRTKGVVNPIKDQRNCGSCWAFGAIQAMESAWAINGNQLLVLSEQFLVDCALLCYGCDGGWPGTAYQFVLNEFNGQFMLNSDYPYEAQQGKCRFDSSKAVTKMKTYITIRPGETNLANAVADNGPIAAAMDASRSTFQLYTSGIYKDSHCSTILNHAIGVVGYGTEGAENYWIIRNSWSTEWGEKGYCRLAKDQRNMCGISNDCMYPYI